MNLLLLMSFILGISSCQTGAQKVDVNLPAQKLMNVAYGKDSAHRMDIYLPEGRNERTPVIIMIHGGAWVNGDKKEFNTYVTSLQERMPQYAIINMNYRLATQTGNHFPTQENDVKAALQYIYNLRSDYHISDKFILLGASAGAHLAMLQAYKYEEPVRVKAVVSFFGPTDLERIYNSQSNSFYQYAMQTLIGGTPKTAPQQFRQSSPLFYAGAKSCPTIILQGDRDNIVDPEQSQILEEKLKASGVPVELIRFPREGHGRWSPPSIDKAFDSIEAFLEENVN